MAWLLPPLPPTFEAALRDVTAKGEPARIAAAQQLGHPDEGRESEALDGLTRLAADGTARVRGAALRGLAELGMAESVTLLVPLLSDTSPFVREHAVVALGHMETPQAVDALIGALASEHPEVRFQAVIACAEVCPRAATEKLPALLTDSDPEVRANAARALGMLGEHGADEDLKAMLADENSEARYEAALALARAGHTWGWHTLAENLNVPDRAMEALDALANSDAREAAPHVAVLALSLLKPLTLKAAASRALTRLGDERGIRGLREVLTAWRSDGRNYAVETVGELELHALAPEVVRLVGRPRGVSHEALAATLGRLAATSPEAKAALERLGPPS